ncbi:DUF7511 domain-containing protein [Natrinema salinisoli]|uniref:DUF7511 domain-containing protein n=1 Tax=Natrinema salinisoli TaxID=2878535 RepID=UPI001CF06184|nr:hypothetical protein [Natrinema salinisoli]
MSRHSAEDHTISESSSHTPGERGWAADRSSRLQHVTVEQEDVAVCTMFPKEIDEDVMSTKWITATTDSFVPLEQRR